MRDKIAARILRKFRQHRAVPPAKGPFKGAPYLSLVVPTYNVERYIERFLASVFEQSASFRKFEVIIVDDGSTDGSAAIVKQWQSRFPDHIRYVHQANGGLSAARNAGLALARGVWVSFPDPDDFLDPQYFGRMLRETRVKHEKPLLAVVSNSILYFEDSDEFSDSHPLRYRFRNGRSRKSTDDLGTYMQLAVNHCWIERAALIESGFTFSSKVVPSFEDGHLLNRLFASYPGRGVSFLPGAKYYYRKRADGTSLVDGTKIRPAWYLDQIEYGYLDLLRFASQRLGHVPAYIQRTCLYDIFWRFRYLVDHDERADFLTNEQQARFVSLLHEVFDFIDAQVIADFKLAGCTEEHKVALLAMFKKQDRDNPAVYVIDMDARMGRTQFKYFSGGSGNPEVRVCVNGRPSPMLQPSRRVTSFLGKPYFQENFFWVDLDDGDEISFEIKGRPCRIRHRGTALGETVRWLALRNALEVREPNPAQLDAEARRLRAYVQASRNRYRGCKVLMDRDDKADDNAEHLYRHMMATGRADNAWFVLSPDSPDWARLEAEGFNLLPFGSDEHVAALMNADFLLSSHADHFVFWPVLKAHFQDLVRYKFVFLQHGVTTNDLSRWLNSKEIRLFVTEMPKEAASIADPEGPYKFSEREVLLSGFPRHDALLSRSRTELPDSILIIPTWRKYLTDEAGRTAMARGKIESFLESGFARNWCGVLGASRLRQIAEDSGLRVVFAPHPNIAMYLDDLDLPDFVETVDVRKGASYQDLLARARLAVTDFSSAASEVAYLQRPVIYYQFDADEMFSGKHVYRSGYFSFQSDGFGPVVTTAQEVLAELERTLNGQELPIFPRRRHLAFPFRDGGSCERVCLALETLSQPRARSADVSNIAGRMDDLHKGMTFSVIG